MKRALAVAAWSAAFGAAVGSYVGGWQVLFAAVKMPLFLLGTLGVSLAALAILASGRLAPGQAVDITLRTLETTASVLGALAGPLFLVGISLPKPAPRAYPAMVLLLIAAVAIAGLVSVARLRRLVGPGIWIAWSALYAFVGAQMGWLLKPWISHTLTDDRFLPLADNLRGNFYEAAWGTFLSFMR
jgi:hypothetical protein